jgi:hypothetical protein
MMTIDHLRKNNLIILECISGSRAYGLETSNSDTDIKGVFLLPKEEFYGLNYISQVNNETNDIVFYEFRRFMELLSVNNPNIIELLNTPEDSIIYKHPALNAINPTAILSKLCCNTFGKFALSQIKKAKGLKKKIVNPVAQERKSVLDFCFVAHKEGAIPITEFLNEKKWKQALCGLVKIPHMRDVYGLYYSENEIFNGLIKGKESNDVTLSSVPKGLTQESLLYFNRDGYSSYCKEYREYWSWVENRNEDRYETTQNHGKQYDAKNMMHVFRLLDMAIEIGKEQKVVVRRPNREFLLNIKAGKFEYEELLHLADEKQREMELSFEMSTLPESPKLVEINTLTYEIRNKLYRDFDQL